MIPCVKQRMMARGRYELLRGFKWRGGGNYRAFNERGGEVSRCPRGNRCFPMSNAMALGIDNDLHEEQ